MNSLAWYALKVRTRSEDIALASLDHYGFETYCPQAKTSRKYSDRVKNIDAPVFPGYVFCHFDLSNKSKVLSSNAVERVVGFGSAPAPVTVAEIEAVRRMVEQGGMAAPLPKSGDRVRITSGSLSGIEGVLVSGANAASFVVSIQLLQRSVALSIDPSFVEKI